MEIKTIKKLEVMPFALTMGAIYGVLGLIIGILMALFIGAMMSMVPFAGQSAAMALGGGLVVIILYPILLFIIGFISSAIMAIVYNFVAPLVGGIKVEVE